MAVKNIIKPLDSTFLAGAAFTGQFDLVNPVGLGKACFLLRINNLTNGIVLISFDGVNIHDQIYTLSSLEVYGGEGSSSPQNHCALWPANTKVWVKGTMGSTGFVYVNAYYQPQNP